MEKDERKNNGFILPSELAPLEELFSSKYQKLLAEKINEHALEIGALKQKHDEKFAVLLGTFEVYISLNFNVCVCVCVFFFYLLLVFLSSKCLIEYNKKIMAHV